jgi:hypothetical protein
MPDDAANARLQRCYAWLLGLYPKAFRDRYAAGMAQTFGDLLRERREAGRSPIRLVCATFLETSFAIAWERAMAIQDWRQPMVQAGLASLFILTAPLMLTLTNPNARLNGGDGGGFDWTLGSFVVMGVLVFAVGLGVQVAARRINRPLHRILAAAAIITVFGLVWVELAVDGVSRLLGF